MNLRSIAALVGVSALTAVAFAPAATPGSNGLPNDGLAQAFAAGDLNLDLDLESTPVNQLELGDINAAGVPFGVTVPCTAGFAGPHPCENVDFASFVPLSELGGGAGSDSWGWHDDMGTPDDESDDRQIALYGTTLGLTYIDITNPNIPLVLGRTTMTAGAGVLWRDVKVYDDHAFFVSEETIGVNTSGIVVIDLTQTRDLTDVTFANEIPVTTTYTGFSDAHNIWINEDTARAYVVGSNKANAGLHIVDISDPANPTHIGDFGEDGYTHDVECVVYTGPDADYNGAGEDRILDTEDDVTPSELCFAANEDTMTIVDVTDAANARQIAKIAYEQEGYTHQSVLTDDMTWLLWNDETDEGATGPGTRTYWTDITELDREVWQDDEPDEDSNDDVCVYTHPLLTVDHNMYITGDILWQANYNGGLQIFRLTDEELADCDPDDGSATLNRIGFFDVDPGLDIGQYGGAWNVYPFFGQDQIIVSSLDEGLYVLQTDFEVGES